MKKDKLIALLQNIEGNPDIYLWNAMVEDWMDIDPDLVELEMVKQRKEQVAKHIRFQYQRDNDTFELTPEQEINLSKTIEDSYKKHYSQWELPNRYVEPQKFKEWYGRSKKVVIINAKTKGKKSFDRFGEVSY
jgi:hypothetical protein